MRNIEKSKELHFLIQSDLEYNIRDIVVKKSFPNKKKSRVLDFESDLQDNIRNIVKKF